MARAKAKGSKPSSGPKAKTPSVSKSKAAKTSTAKTSAAKTSAKKSSSAAKQTKTTPKAAAAKKTPSSPSKVAQPIKELKPGWTSRVFGIETGSLIACDAQWAGANWERGEKFRFLYRSRRGKFFLLQDVQNWCVLTEDDAQKLFGQLPEKLVTKEQAFATPEIEPVPKSRDEDEDTRKYKVVRNDKWDFSIWLDYKEVPPGWKHIGVTGTKHECLEYIQRNCVFGAPNPGIG